jgi:hypothetical protein
MRVTHNNVIKWGAPHTVWAYMAEMVCGAAHMAATVLSSRRGISWPAISTARCMTARAWLVGRGLSLAYAPQAPRSKKVRTWG